MISEILFTALLLSNQNLHTAQCLILHPSPQIKNNSIHPASTPYPNPIFRAILYDIPNTELTLYVSDLFRRIDNQIGHDLLRYATQEAQSAVTSGRGDLPLRPRCWNAERGGYRLQIQGGGPRTEITARQMSYEILLEAVKGLETFFSEVQGGYYLLFFFVLARGSTHFTDGYGFGRLMNMRTGVEESGHSNISDCIGGGEEWPAEVPVQVDRLMR